MDPELAALSRDIDPAVLGKRIRNARVAAGMTQAKLAADDVTTAYISRIEDGQRRPEAGLLERMAARMNSSLEELLLGVSRNQMLELQVAVDHAELELASGNAAAALAAADQLLGQLGDSTPALVRQARRVRAFALEATGDLDGAIRALEDLRDDPTPDAGWLKTLIALSRCYRDSGDLGRAIGAGESAEAEIERLGLACSTEAIQLSVTVAGAYMLRGDLGHARRMCERAIGAADEYDSPVARASAYWNASVIEARSGAPERALDLARKAIVTFELGEDGRNLARLRGELANIQLQLDPPDPLGAIETLTQVDREMAWTSATTYDKARALLTRAQAHFLLGQPETALDCLERSQALAPADAPMMRASTHALRGRIAAAAADTTLAREHYLLAAQAMTGIGADREAAQLWFDLGGLLSEVGDDAAAMDAFKRAAASTGLNSTSTHANTATSRPAAVADLVSGPGNSG